MELNYPREKIILSEYLTDSPFCIYGAGIVASGIYTAIRTLYNKKPLFFLVSDAPEGKCDENPDEIDDIAVKRLSEWKKELQTAEELPYSQRSHTLPDSSRCGSSPAETDCGSMNIVQPELYLVITPQTHHPAIVESLHSLNIEDSQIRLFTSEMENEVMEAYYSGTQSRLQNKYGTVTGMLFGKKSHDIPFAKRSNEIIEEKSRNYIQAHEIQVFQAKCHVDRALDNPKENPSYVYPIQVGAALTDQVISQLRDNEGDNISDKNRNYCELTASYHAWKNSSAPYKGLCHYRRIFDINDEQMDALLASQTEWDVILPYPSIHYPNISIQHKRYINDADWEAMLMALKETAPDYYDAYTELIRSGEKYFYNFNMLIARAEVFDDYCSFMFEVLERAGELTVPKSSERADRFAGYMGENLTTLYFHKNRGKLKILYAGKLWLT